MGLDMYAYAEDMKMEKKNLLLIGENIIACMVGWKTFGNQRADHTKGI